MEYFDIVVLVLLPPLHTLKVFTACSLRGFAVVWSFAPWRRPWLPVRPRPDMMSCVWRAAVIWSGRGLSSYCHFSVHYLSPTALPPHLMLGRTHDAVFRFRKCLYVAKHVTVCNYIICRESYLKCIIGSFAAHLKSLKSCVFECFLKTTSLMGELDL